MAFDKLTPSDMKDVDSGTFFRDAAPKPQQSSYTSEATGAAILQDPRFLRDLRDFYYERDGAHFGSDEELIDHFYTDRNWRDLNTVSVARDLKDVYGFNDEQLARFSRIQEAWNQLPSMFSEGGRGWGAVPDVAAAIIADPLNFVGFGAGKGAALAAAQGTKKAAWQGIKSVAKKEAALGAGIEAAADAGIQARETHAGLRSGFSGTQLATSALLGGAAGALGGAAFGLPQALRGKSAGEALQRAVESGDEEAIRAARANIDHTVGPVKGLDTADDMIARLRENARAQQADAPDAPTPEDAPEAPAARPEDEVHTVLVDNITDVKKRLIDPDLEPEERQGLEELEVNLRGQLALLDDVVRHKIKLQGAEETLAQARKDGAQESIIRKMEQDIRDLKFQIQDNAIATAAAQKTGTGLANSIHDLWRTRAYAAEPSQLLSPEAAAANDAAGLSRPDSILAADPDADASRPASTQAQASNEAHLQTQAIIDNAAGRPAGPALPAPDTPQGPRIESGDTIVPPRERLTTTPRGDEVQVGETPLQPDAPRTFTPEEVAKLWEEHNRLLGVSPQVGGRKLKKLGIDRTTPEGQRALAAEVERLQRAAQADQVVSDLERSGSYQPEHLRLLRHLLTREPDSDDSFPMAGDDVWTTIKDTASGLLDLRIKGLDEPQAAKARAELEERIGEVMGRSLAASTVEEILSGRNGSEAVEGLKRTLVTITDDIANRYTRQQARRNSGNIRSQAGSMVDKAPSDIDDGRVPRDFKGPPIDPSDFPEQAAKLEGRMTRGALANARKDLETSHNTVKFAYSEVQKLGGEDAFKTISEGGLKTLPADAQEAYRLYRNAKRKVERLSQRVGELEGKPAKSPMADPQKRAKAKEQAAELEALARQERIVQESAEKVIAAVEEGALPPAVVADLTAAAKRGDHAALIETLSKLNGQKTPRTSATPLAEFPNKMMPALRYVGKKDGPKHLIRVLSPKQAALGGSLEDHYARLLKNADPTEWERVFAPEGTHNNPKAALDGARTREQLDAGDMPAMRPVPFEKLANTTVDFQGERASVKDVWRTFNRLEAEPLPQSVTEFDVRIDALKELKRVLPENMILPRSTREDAARVLNDIYYQDPLGFVVTSRLLDRLGTRSDAMPTLKRAKADDTHLGQYSPSDNALHVSPRDAHDMPTHAVMAHEIGHWGYFNLLDFDDRIEFYDFLKSRALTDTGQLDHDALRAMMHPRLRSSATESNVQEIFANLFASYALDQAPFRTHDTFWGRVASKAAALLDAFRRPWAAPKEVEPLLRKIIPEEDVLTRWAENTYKTPREAGLEGDALTKATRTLSTLSRAQQNGSDVHQALSDALRTGDFDNLQATLERAEGWMASAYKNGSWLRPRKGKGDWRAFYTLKKIDHTRVRLHSLLSELEGVEHEFSNVASMSAAQREAEIDRLYSESLAEEGMADSLQALSRQDRALVEQDILQSSYQIINDMTHFKRDDLDEVQLTLADVAQQVMDVTREYTGVVERVYQRQTGGASIAPAGTIHDFRHTNPASARFRKGGPRKAAKAKVQASAATRTKRAEKQQSVTEAHAIETTKAKTEPNRAFRKKTAPTPHDGGPLAAMAKEDLLREFRVEGPKTQRGVELAHEVADRVRAKAELPSITISKAVADLSERDLRRGLHRALLASDKKAVTEHAVELATRRGDTDSGILDLLDSRFTQAVEREALETTGVFLQEGIPANAPEAFKVLLRPINNRNPDVQRKARLIAYRMLNLLGADARTALDDVTVVPVNEVYRMAGKPAPADARAVFFDTNDSAYAAIRSQARRLAIGLTNDADPFDVLHEVGHMLSRTVLSPDEHATFVEAFRHADDPIAARVRELYSDKSFDHQAEEYLAESVTQFLAERVAKGDLFKLRQTGDLDAIRLKNSLEVGFDRMREGFAYLTNRLIDNPSMRQSMRQLTWYGDMFAQARRPAVGPLAQGVLPHTARRVVGDALRSMSDEQYARLSAFHTEYDANGQMEYYFHGTPNSNWLDDADAVVRFTQAREGFHGPGFYATQSEHVAYGTYAQGGTDKSVSDLVEHLRSQGVKGEELDEAEALIFDRQVNSDDVRAFRAYDVELREQLAAAGPDGDPDVTLEIERNAKRLSKTEKTLREIDDELGARFNASSRVIPVAVSLQKAFNFRESDTHVVMDRDRNLSAAASDVADLIDALKAHHGLRDDALMEHLNRRARLNERAGVFTLSGHDLYLALQDGLMDSVHNPNWVTVPGGYTIGAADEITHALKRLGYDGLRSTDKSEKRPYEVVVAFGDAGQVKHLSQAMAFDRDLEGLYQSRHGRNDGPSPSAGMWDAAARSDEEVDPHKLYAASAPWWEASGAGPKLRHVLHRMSKGDSATEGLAEFSWPLQLRSNSRRMREVSGAKWLADWISPENAPSMHARHASNVAKHLMPLHELIREVSSDSVFTSYLRKVSGLGGNTAFHRKMKQPRELAKVVQAVRRGPAAINRLEGKNRELAQATATFFETYMHRLRDAGVRVGTIGNYFPQMYDVNVVASRPKAFQQVIFNHLKRQTRLIEGAPPISDERAQEVAQRIMTKILDEDGLVVDSVHKSRRAPIMDQEFTRMLRFDLDRDGLAEVEEFLSSDLLGVLAKYADSAERRIEFADKFGINSHGYHDYLHVATRQRDGLLDLLTTSQVYRNHSQVLGTGEAVSVEETLLKPMPDGPAVALTDKLMAMRDAGADAQELYTTLINARRTLDMGGEDQATFEKRAEAIAHSLVDFKTSKGISSYEMGHIESTWNVIQNKRVYQGAQFDRRYATSRFLKNVNLVTLLSYTTLTSLTDLVIPILRSGEMRHSLKAIYHMATDPDYRQAIRNIGVTTDNLVHERFAALYGQIGHGEQSNTVVSAFFNASGLTPWTNVMREVAGIHGYEAMRSMAERAQRNYRPHMAAQSADYRTALRFLKHYGLEEYATNPKLKFGSIQDATRDDRLRHAVLQFANETIFSPSPDDIPVWAQTPYGALAAQLKTFPMMMGRLSRHVIDEAREGNTAPLKQMLTIGGAMGMGTLLAKDVLQMRGGEDERSAAPRERKLSNLIDDFGLGKPNLNMHINGFNVPLDEFLGWYVEGFLMLGGLGAVAELLYNTAAQSDNGAWGMSRTMSYALGPTFDLIAVSGWNFLSAARDGSPSNAKERTAVRTVIGRTPLIGGNRAAREGLTDAIAGPARSSSSASRGGHGGGWRGWHDGH